MQIDNALAMEMHEQLQVEPVGDIILVRLRGESSAALLKECNALVVALVKGTGRKKVLYDLQEYEQAPMSLIAVQQALNHEVKDIPLKRAIVASNAKLAFSSRIAFGENSQVFSDMTRAVKWLEQD